MKQLNKYQKKRKTRIQSLMRTPRLQCTPETFHHLRVEIKKIRSLLSLLKFSAENFHRKKMERPFRKIFKQAGEIREIHVEEEMLQRYFSVDFLNEYRQKLKERKSKELRNYSALAERLEMKFKKNFNKIKPWISQVTQEKVLDFIEERQKKILLLFENESIEPSQVHLLRKRLKQYNYALKISKESTPLLTDTQVLADLSGKWHDGQVLLNHLDRQIHSPGISNKEQEQIEKIRKEQITVNNLVFNQIKETVLKMKEQSC